MNAFELCFGKIMLTDCNICINRIVLLERDDSDEFVTDIVESICNNTLDIIFKNYIQKQLIPYTVCQVKDAIVQIIEVMY